ncbi:MAG TPA: hypothetical protein VHK69_18240 [Chitinophagaceae bacterium]|jgi:hypothetical protein|nr:hypothetical protein [Chitinophagaceae bacterium]
MNTKDQRPEGGPEQPVKDVPQTGNASNPTPYDKSTDPAEHQLLGEQAEKYLREVAAPEDYPDAQDELDAENQKE